jgi:hypothetical protein
MVARSPRPKRLYEIAVSGMKCKKMYHRKPVQTLVKHIHQDRLIEVLCIMIRRALKACLAPENQRSFTENVTVTRAQRWRQSSANGTRRGTTAHCPNIESTLLSREISDLYKNMVVFSLCSQDPVGAFGIQKHKQFNRKHKQLPTSGQK